MDRRRSLLTVGGVGVVAGVPLVAAGITLSTFGVRLPEGVAAWFLAAATLLVAGLQLRLAARPGQLLPRVLFFLSGLSLLAGMALVIGLVLLVLMRPLKKSMPGV